MTNKEAVSRITTALKLSTKDTRIPARGVLRILRSTALTYIAQRLTERTLQFDYNLYTDINCLEFQKIDVISCPFVEFRTCRTLMKSKKPLPTLVHSRIGASIRDVRSIDESLYFTITDALQYNRNTKRRYSLKSEVYIYLASDGHLYIADQEIYAVNLSLITMEPEKVNEICGCGDKKDSCKSYWDYTFICPDKLLDQVLSRGMEIIAATYANIIKDSNPNGIDRQPTA